MTALKSVLICLILIAGAFPSVVAAERNAQRVPDGDVGAARIFSQSLGGKPDPVMAENVLRIFALRGPDEVVDRNLAWVRRSDWSPEFKAMFARAVAWARRTRRLSPDELYRLSREFRARPNAGDRFFESVADELRALAAYAGQRKAKRELDEWRRNYQREWSPSDHARMMKDIGKGDARAMYMLSYRYEHAEGLERNLAKSYYWLLRARERGGKMAEDVAIAIRLLDGMISSADRKRALKWFRDKTVPRI